MGILRKLFGKYLLLTNTVSCGLMMAGADVLQQNGEQWKKQYQVKTGRSGLVMAASPENEIEEETVEIENKEHDFTRTRNMMVVGLLQGPFHHYFYALLDRRFPGRCAASVLKKTLLDQTIASPTCLGIFFIGLGVLERHDLKQIKEEVKLKFFATWKIDCCFWPPTQLVNFLFIPGQYRVMYTNLMTMVYDIFLSYMKYDAAFD